MSFQYATKQGIFLVRNVVESCDLEFWIHCDKKFEKIWGNEIYEEEEHLKHFYLQYSEFAIVSVSNFKHDLIIPEWDIVMKQYKIQVTAATGKLGSSASTVTLTPRGKKFLPQFILGEEQ